LARIDFGFSGWSDTRNFTLTVTWRLVLSHRRTFLSIER